MKIKKLSLKNIRSYQDQEIEFPDGSLLLSGDVGSGKTTILLALEYALFGLQPGQKGSALLRNDSDLGEVSLELEISGNPVVIERKIKRGSKSVTNDYASITYDDKKLESSITEVKTKILSLLGYPSEFIKKNNILYRYTVYTPQEQMKQIILEDSETRLNVLRHVFGIDKYKRIRENLVILLNRLKEESKVLQLEIKALDSERERLLSLNNSITELENGLKIKEKEFEFCKKIRREIESQVLELDEKSKNRNILESEIEKTKIMISSKRESIFTIMREDAELSALIEGSGERFSQDILNEVSKKIFIKEIKIEELNEKNILIVSGINSLKTNKEARN